MNSATNIPVQAKKPGKVLPWLMLTVGIVLGFMILVLAGFFYFASLIGETPLSGVREADAIVVLTGGEARIPEAIKLLSQGKGGRLLISGVNPITTRKELASLAPDSKHWFRCCIDVDQVARDTVGNANETRNWVKNRGFKSLIVVTSSYHMPRSLAEFRRALPDTEFIAYSVTPGNLRFDAWWRNSDAFQLLAMEYAKFLPAFGRCFVIQIGRDQGLNSSARQCLNFGVPG